MAVKLFEAAVRGYHKKCDSWIPVENQELDNPYDYFAIKTCESASGKIVRYLPMEISRPTKFLLQRRAVIKVTLSSTNYRKSPLVQGGLEIPCRVSVSMPAMLKNRQIIEKFKDMVGVLYDEPDDIEV